MRTLHILIFMLFPILAYVAHENGTTWLFLISSILSSLHALTSLFSKYSFFCAILIIVSCIVGFSLADSFWYKVLLGLSISEFNICLFVIINNVYAERQMKKWIKEQDTDIQL